jgi:hypothetical protein
MKGDVNDSPTPPADLYALYELVDNERTFGAFLHALAADFDADRELLAADPEKYKYSSGPLGWEQSTISDLLYTAAAGVGSRPPLQHIAENPWKRCAQILLTAKVLE